MSEFYVSDSAPDIESGGNQGHAVTTEDAIVQTLNCRHVFHKHCIARYVRREDSFEWHVARHQLCLISDNAHFSCLDNAAG